MLCMRVVHVCVAKNLDHDLLLLLLHGNEMGGYAKEGVASGGSFLDKFALNM